MRSRWALHAVVAALFWRPEGSSVFYRRAIFAAALAMAAAPAEANPAHDQLMKLSPSERNAALSRLMAASGAEIRSV